MCGFAFLFGLFVAARFDAEDLFDASRRQLSVGFGLANTIILLSSGALVAYACRLARAGEWGRSARWTLAAVAVGGAFGVCKVLEWTLKARAGITPTTNEYFGYYFALTGIHFLHYLIGLVALLIIAKCARSSASESDRLRWLEMGAAYWHMVDLLWFFIFALLYLLRSQP